MTFEKFNGLAVKIESTPFFLRKIAHFLRISKAAARSGT
jgi:hypothetical protein